MSKPLRFSSSFKILYNAMNLWFKPLSVRLNIEEKQSSILSLFSVFSEEYLEFLLIVARARSCSGYLLQPEIV